MATPDNLTNMNSRPQRILLETGRYRIIGTLVLPRDGYRSRLSDFLNSSDRDFISLTDVSMQALDEYGRPGDPVEHAFVTVARQHVILATTTD
jgi:Family of unknown function (DUF6812)